MHGSGRYAPSPSGDLHFGNLRTAMVAWLAARSTGREFIMRVEDIDTQRSSMDSAHRQLEDLAALGIEWDAVEYQSDNGARYAAALDKLPTFECYCSRKDIQEAASAPHAIPGQYPGTCRDLSPEQRESKREQLQAAGRVPAIRLASEVSSWRVHDLLHGDYTGDVDDFILRRGGNANQGRDWAYNLAVVVDDGARGIDQVVRGDDLLSSAPRQAYLAHLLGHEAPEYIHVPLVVNAEGKRLAKRDGAVTLRQLREQRAVGDADVVRMIAESLGYPGLNTAQQLLDAFDVERIPRWPHVWE